MGKERSLVPEMERPEKGHLDAFHDFRRNGKKTTGKKEAKKGDTRGRIGKLVGASNKAKGMTATIQTTSTIRIHRKVDTNRDRDQVGVLLPVLVNQGQEV